MKSSVTKVLAISQWKWISLRLCTLICVLGLGQASSGVGQEPNWIASSMVNASESVDLIGVPLPDVSHRSDWAKQRASILAKWNNYLGSFHENRTTNQEKPKIEWLESKTPEPGLSQSLIRYETEPGQFVEAYVLGPEKNSGKRPGVVVFHSTVNHSIDQCVGLGDTSKGSATPSQDELRKAYALHLARRGFVTLSPKNFLWPKKSGIAAEHEAKAFLERNPSRKGMARMLLDAQCAVDVLCSLNGVDKNRIGAIGHSLGAKEVLYLGAFDDRVRSVVSSEGGLAIEQSNWDAAWYLGSGCKPPQFDSNHHELVALIAPRAFLLIGGESSDGSKSLPYLSSAAKIFLVHEAQRSLAFINHRQGHNVTDESLRQSLEWLEWHLR